MSAGGGPLVQGSPLRIEVTVFSSASYANERLDLYEWGTPFHGSWPFWPSVSFLGSVYPTRAGEQVLSLEYTPAFPAVSQMVRAVFRPSYEPNTDVCPYACPYSDTDDLWFRLDSAPGNGSHALALDHEGTGVGMVAVSAGVSPPFASCTLYSQGPYPLSPACDYELPDFLEVVLTPMAGPESRFTGWSGACSGTGPCTLTMAEARQVWAQFDKVPTPVLTIVLDGLDGAHGNGQRRGDGPYLHCELPGRCRERHLPRPPSRSAPLVHLQRASRPGSVFAGMGRRLRGSAPPPSARSRSTTP